jgi:pimeloyl-ACP methyl ester carboxylesterase
MALYAERYPKKIRALAPISTVVSGQLSAETSEKNGLEEWKRTGWKSGESSTKSGLIKRIKVSEFEDRMKYDLLPEVDKLTMPVLLITGDQDIGTPPEHHKILYDALPGKKELHIIKSAPHTFKDPEHLAEIKVIFDKWIKNTLNS